MKARITDFVGLFILISASCFAQNRQPNVLFFLVDDLGWKDVSYAGSEFYETPHIDEVAYQGKIFTQAYAAHPRCVPSRYAMITGRYPARIKSPGKGEGKLTDMTFTLAESFKEAGYTTFFAGKWHLASANSYPDTQGFDYNFGGGHAGAPKSYFQPYNKPKKGKGNGREKNISNLEDAPEGYYLTDHLTDKTIDFIKNHKSQPFFIYLSHYGVHTPFECKEEKVKSYRRKVRLLYGNEEVAEYDFDKTTGETKLRQDNPVYAGMVASIDESFGRIVKLLKELRIYENTIIVFTSDHGGLSNRGNFRKTATSNLPLRAGKGHNYEGGVRIPMFVSWPGKIQPGKTETIITGMDYFPTLTDLCSLKPHKQAYLDGESFASCLLKNDTPNVDRAIFWHSPLARPQSTGDYPNTAVRLGNYKLLDFYEENRLELFNLTDDEQEQHNLADVIPKKKG